MQAQTPIILCLLSLGLGQPLGAEPAPSQAASLVVSASVVQREEVWNRRSNSLMGRPDFLQEIRLQLGSLQVRSGSLPAGTTQIAVSVQGQKALLACRSLSQGSSGLFYLDGGPASYGLLSVESVLKPAATAAPAPTQVQVRPSPAVKRFPDEIGGRELQASPALQKKALRIIAERYGLREAKLIFLTSFQGPMPPRGGYLYWGVRGKIKGHWHVWQPGERAPRLGNDLDDPQKGQK